MPVADILRSQTKTRARMTFQSAFGACNFIVTWDGESVYDLLDAISFARQTGDRFIQDNNLARYERLHVFAFLAGAWTLNPLLDGRALPNLATVVYDRSPYQERAPRIASPIRRRGRKRSPICNSRAASRTAMIRRAR